MDPTEKKKVRIRRDQHLRPHQVDANGYRTADAMVDSLVTIREARFDQIRELVIKHRRFDILAKHVLGYDVQEHHQTMMDWQRDNDEGMLLAWRGAAKTTYCTTAYAIGSILCDPNIRILLAADAADQAKTFLRGIKFHFERNDLFRQIFGDHVAGARLWSESEIMVNRRTDYGKREATITTCGTETSLPGRHFELILADDVVTKDNSQTEGQRKKLYEWYYNTLYPTLESPNGKIYIIGTRWHPEDLYGWLGEEDFKGMVLRIPVLDDDDLSVWETNFPTKKMHRLRNSNLRAFILQYMCDSAAGIGGIFTPDHFTFVDGLFPDGELYKWQGVDLAVGQKNRNDYFAHATVGVHKITRKPYLYELEARKMKFPDQINYINRKYRDHPDTVRVVIESNAFQGVVKQQLNHQFPDIPVQSRWTHKDKVVRANQLAAIVGPGGIFVRRQHHAFIRHMCLLPTGKHDDQFDAFYLAVIQGLKGARKRRRQEPGLI